MAFIPGLLMLATIGLERLESALGCDTVSANDVAEFLQQAKADDMDTLARDGMSQALDNIHRRLQDRESAATELAVSADTSGLPTRLYIHQLANPGFQPTRHANRV